MTKNNSGRKGIGASKNQSERKINKKIKRKKMTVLEYKKGAIKY